MENTAQKPATPRLSTVPLRPAPGKGLQGDERAADLSSQPTEVAPRGTTGSPKSQAAQPTKPVELLSQPVLNKHVVRMRKDLKTQSPS